MRVLHANKGRTVCLLMATTLFWLSMFLDFFAFSHVWSVERNTFIHLRSSQTCLQAHEDGDNLHSARANQNTSYNECPFNGYWRHFNAQSELSAIVCYLDTNEIIKIPISNDRIDHSRLFNFAPKNSPPLG